MQTTPGTSKFPLETSSAAHNVHIFQNIPRNEYRKLPAKTPKLRNRLEFPVNENQKQADIISYSQNIWKRIRGYPVYYTFPVVNNVTKSGISSNQEDPICCHCYQISSPMNKCLRCKKNFIDSVKLLNKNLISTFNLFSSSSTQEAQQVSKSETKPASTPPENCVGPTESSSKPKISKMDTSVEPANKSQIVCLYCGYFSCGTNTCQRCNRKLFSLKRSSTRREEEPDISTPEGKVVVCTYCGYCSSLWNKCQRCNRPLLGPVTLVDVPPRPTGSKSKNPPCVTMSSSEDEDDPSTSTSEEPNAKKLRTEERATRQMPKTRETIVQETRGLPVLKENPKPQCSPEKAVDTMKWKEAGLKGSFFSLKCRSARIGSYNVKPIDRILVSTEGIVMDVPTVNADGKSVFHELVRLVLSRPEIIKADVRFGKNVPIIVIYMNPCTGRIIKTHLRLSKNVPDASLDVQSDNDSEKRIILFPQDLTNEAEKQIKQTFSIMGICNEISADETIEMLIQSCYTV